MLDQMKLLFNIENDVKVFKQQKIKRLENNLFSEIERRYNDGRSWRSNKSLF